jgi:hypothetical protein
VQGGEKGFEAAGAALSDARQIPLPPDVRRLEPHFEKLAIIKSDLDAVLPEWRTGQRGDDLAARVLMR